MKTNNRKNTNIIKQLKKQTNDLNFIIEYLQLAVFIACDSDMVKFVQIVADCRKVVKKYRLMQIIDEIKTKLKGENK